MKGDRQERLLGDPEVRRTFEEELLFGEATDTLAGLLHSLGITQRELARRLGVSAGRVSQVLSGGENLTLRTLGALGWALGVRFGLNPIPMQNRAGTPAEQDPPAPGWLQSLWAPPKWRFESSLQMPGRPAKLEEKLEVKLSASGKYERLDDAA